MNIAGWLRTGTHLRCYPSHRFAAGPSPFTEPRAATPSGANTYRCLRKKNDFCSCFFFMSCSQKTGFMSRGSSPE